MSARLHPATLAAHLRRKGFRSAIKGPRDLLRIRVRVGKHVAGRLLDGREWNEVPGEA